MMQHITLRQAPAPMAVPFYGGSLIVIIELLNDEDFEWHLGENESPLGEIVKENFDYFSCEIQQAIETQIAENKENFEEWQLGI